MKEQALEQFEVGQKSLAEALYYAGHTDGVAEGKVLGYAEYAANDQTKFNDEDLAKAVEDAKAPLKEKIAALEISLSQKDAEALEEALADQLEEMAKQLRNRTIAPAPVVEAPVEAPVVEEPVVEAPIEETVGTDAQP